jgi:hypothetical protein|tara:strand:- start:190 stop:387 length:198 start_codon:yes stop_codon:yes gene_type:complete
MTKYEETQRSGREAAEAEEGARKERIESKRGEISKLLQTLMFQQLDLQGVHKTIQYQAMTPTAKE